MKPATSVNTAAVAKPVHMCFGRFELDEVNARLLCAGEPVGLAPRPFAVLCSLARQPGALISKNALLDAVWGHRFVSDSVLKTAVSELRYAIGDDPKRPRYVETVSRHGYRFIGGPGELRFRPAPVVGAGAPTATHSNQASPVKPARRAPSMTGRREELARLRAAWELACSGRRTLVWVAGDAGIGKTTLIDRLSAELGDDVAIARGQCVEHYAAGEPYLPILEALAELCRADESMVRLLRSVAPTWLLRLPWLSAPDERARLRHELTGVREDRMLRELGELLDRYTERKPLLLVTEDMHWSDHATVQLMDHMARRRGGARLMWLASFRLVEVVAYDHPLKALRHELRMHGLCEEIVLDPFSEQEVAAYVAEHAPSVAGNKDVVRALYEGTDGLPLFVAHVVDELARGAFGEDAPTALCLGQLTIPENLAGVIDHQVSRLAPEELRVLEAAAVCGVQFRANTLAAALSREPACVSRICDELARGHLWLRPVAEDCGCTLDAPYTFRHALVRQRLRQRTGPLARSLLEAKVAAALQREQAVDVPLISADASVNCEAGGAATSGFALRTPFSAD